MTEGIFRLNNPLKYTDPSGEVFVVDDILIGMVVAGVIAGTINLMTNSQYINSGWDALGYFGVVFAVGAMAFAVGTMAPAGIIPGAVYGGISGALAGGMTQMGNNLVAGRPIMEDVGRTAAAGAVFGAIGGAYGGYVKAKKMGVNRLTGVKVLKEEVYEQKIPFIKQNSSQNCLPANVEAIDKSYGGTLTQDDVRAWYPNTDTKYALDDTEVWEDYTKYRNYKLIEPYSKNTKIEYITAYTKEENARISLTITNESGGAHSVVVERVVIRKYINPFGKVRTSINIYAMDPWYGRNRFIPLSRIINVFIITP